MNGSETLEYLCPHCNHVNSIRHDAIRDMYKEQFTHCDSCQTKLEIIPADGINESINLVVSLALPDVQSR